MVLEWALKYIQGTVLENVKEAAINNLPGENKYTELGSKGKLLSWVESLPVVGNVLENLGDNRRKLYSISLHTKPAKLV